MNYETAHLVARLAGEESLNHPRQRAARWLEASGRVKLLSGFNSWYETSTASFLGQEIPIMRASCALQSTLIGYGCTYEEAKKLANLALGVNVVERHDDQVDAIRGFSAHTVIIDDLQPLEGRVPEDTHAPVP